ncbi:Uncharacterised protein [Fusobacterium necrophorum subsp. necrophorum]|nr:Uncharacterised protein [Fusobacterium necrophorum subsp. necrophorum]
MKMRVLESSPGTAIVGYGIIDMKKENFRL